MIIPPLIIHEKTIGSASVKEIRKDVFTLSVDGQVWMQHSLKNYRQIFQQLLEIKIGKGKCALTGLGFGFLALILAKKEDVSSVTVYELNKDVISMFYYFCKENNISNNIMQKINIIEQDANTITDQNYDCGLFDHFELEEFDYIIDCVKTLSYNNNFNTVWFWPAGGIYFDWCDKENKPVDCNSLEEFINFINIKNCFKEINPLTHYFATTGYVR
jgi:hypothetical protein